MTYKKPNFLFHAWDGLYFCFNVDCKVCLSYFEKEFSISCPVSDMKTFDEMAQIAPGLRGNLGHFGKPPSTPSPLF